MVTILANLSVLEQCASEVVQEQGNLLHHLEAGKKIPVIVLYCLRWQNPICAVIVQNTQIVWFAFSSSSVYCIKTKLA